MSDIPPRDNLRNGKRLSSEQLIAALRDMIAVLEERDSLEGRIAYEPADYDHFYVEAFYRVGNSMGQGGSVSVYMPRCHMCEKDPSFSCGSCGPHRGINES